VRDIDERDRGILGAVVDHAMQIAPEQD